MNAHPDLHPHPHLIVSQDPYNVSDLHIFPDTRDPNALFWIPYADQSRILLFIRFRTTHVLHEFLHHRQTNH